MGVERDESGEVDIFCDYLDCIWSFDGIPGEPEQMVVEMAKDRGWVYRDGKWYCSAHAGEKGAEKGGET